MWKFLVKNQSIEILEREVLADHQIQYVQFKFTFDGDWKKFHKVVQFSQCDEIYSIALGFDGTTCYLPAELHVGAVKMSVFGYNAESDTTVRATTVPVTLNIRESGFVGDDDIPIPPTPDLYTQLLRKIAEIQAGVDGRDGLSAYEIAKENGFAGTVSEWLESLKGLPGRDGVDGRDGTDGISPDMSEYSKTEAVEMMIQEALNPLLQKSHEHENQSVLDNITASYTLEEQRKLAEIDPSEYATKADYPPTSAVELMIQKITEPLSLKSHEHENQSVLDNITASYTLEEQQKLAEIDPSEYATKEDYPPTSAVELMIQKITEPLSLKSHEHENQSILDNITASYTLEEQQKLAEIQPSDYATKERLNEEILSVRESMIPLTRELHSHSNKAVLDSLTAEDVAALGGLQQFEDSTKYDIQTIRESVEPVVSQAHWHHNLTLLNSLTSAKIAKWDGYENFGTQINGLSTRITIYSDKVDNSVARIGTAELNIENLQKQIDQLKNNGYTVLFEYGESTIEKYSDTIGFMLNGGFHTMTNFCNQYEYFCCAENEYCVIERFSLISGGCNRRNLSQQKLPATAFRPANITLHGSAEATIHARLFVALRSGR